MKIAKPAPSKTIVSVIVLSISMLMSMLMLTITHVEAVSGQTLARKAKQVKHVSQVVSHAQTIVKEGR